MKSDNKPLTDEQRELFASKFAVYYENDCKKLHQIVKKVLKQHTWITDFDYFYSLADEIFVNEIIKHYDGKSDVEAWVVHCLKMKLLTAVTAVNRVKRTPYLMDDKGNRIKDKDGEYVKATVVSFDAPTTEDGEGFIKDIVSSGEDVEKTAVDHVQQYSERTMEYLKKLSPRQREVAKLIMADCTKEEIMQKLRITKGQYSAAIKAMKSYENSRVLRRENSPKNQEEKEMEAFTSAEKNKSTGYSVESICRKLRSRQIDDSYPLQRASGQWSHLWKGELVSCILRNKAFTQIIISEEIRPDYTVNWLIDGKQRCTNMDDYMNDGYSVCKNIKNYMIEYQTAQKDEKGNVICNEEGRPIFERKVCDIRGKKFSKLPIELQERFKEYQFPVLLNLSCTKEEIREDIVRFNRGRAMNAAQSGWTGIREEYAEYVDKILKLPFFKDDCETSSYSKGNDRAGGLRRIVVESIMVSNFLDEYIKDFYQMCELLSDRANDDMFFDMMELIQRIEKVATEEVKEFFNLKNSFLWFSLFSKFDKLNIGDDKRFIDFLVEFKNELHSCKVNGECFDVLNANSTKDKNVINKEITLLETLMQEYLVGNLDDDFEQKDDFEEVEELTEIEEVDAESREEDIEEDSVEEANDGESDEVDPARFISEVVDLDMKEVEIDMDCYNETLDKLLNDRIRDGSKLLDDRNRLSLLAMTAYSYKTEYDLDRWLEDYGKRNNTYVADSRRNFEIMVRDLEEYAQRVA